MSKPLSKAQFRKLQATWYKKLDKSGFKDIEERGSPREYLKQWDHLYFRNSVTPEQFAQRVKYFDLCADLLRRYSFDMPRDKAIWEMHADGATSVEISKKLRLDINAVKRTIYKLRKNFVRGAS